MRNRPMQENRACEQNEELMREKLKKVQNAGVSLYLEGDLATPEMIANRFVKEETIYMADYVLDEKGVLTELRYDKLSNF